MNQAGQIQAHQTRLALLGTLGFLHTESLTYDLNCLRSIVLTLTPDILCAEITREEWEQGDLSNSAIELRQVIVPVIHLTDMVLVPVASSSTSFEDHMPSSKVRQLLIWFFDHLLRWGQRTADKPENIHSTAFGIFCHLVCTLTEMMWTAEDRRFWNAQNQSLAEGILNVLRRDPGRRVLVVVQCQRLHRLIQYLRKFSNEIEIVSYRAL
jgi:hypothetical protein